ncbi:hypothetical protein DPMN_144769 [Dreissena polymorpha]|uniref:Uncharacterized protein n=1 Tax=Dreissena polymorpha TaxID=45954 RepID=A0A9D4IWV8_DREPO|nr:hypothetical protein DPMN_144769 [Dreissena polymorpha]
MGPSRAARRRVDLRHRAPCKTLTTWLRPYIGRRQTIWLPLFFGLCTVPGKASITWLLPYFG